MKKSEIIKFLSERDCRISSYYRDGNSLNVCLNLLSGFILKDLHDKGFILFIEAVEKDVLFLEIIGNIEWD